MTAYRYGLTGKDRKELVKAISEILGTEHRYCGPPRYEFAIGDEYTVDRDGTLLGPENISLITRLADKGFELETGTQPEAEPLQEIVSEPEEAATQAETVAELEETAAEAEATPEPSETAEQADTALESSETAVEAETMPEQSEIAAEVGTMLEPSETTEQADTTLEPSETAPEMETTPDSGETAPEQAEEAEPDRLTIEYPLTNITDEVLTNLRKMVAAKEPILKLALGAEELPILLTPNSIKLPWFTGPFDEDKAHAYAQFVACLIETAKRKKRVTAQPIITDNARFSMRVWCISLGMVGPAYSLSRQLLYKNLAGDSGWRFGPPKKAEKQANTTNSADILPDNTESDSGQ